MILLNDYELPVPFDYQKYPVEKFILSEFPDPRDASDNAPMWLIAPEALLAFVQKLREFFQLPQVTRIRDITFADALMVRDYAYSVGWGKTYMAGNQLILGQYSNYEDHVPRNIEKKELRTVFVDVPSDKPSFNLYNHVNKALDNTNGEYLIGLTSFLKYWGPVDKLLVRPMDAVTVDGCYKFMQCDDDENNVRVNFNYNTGHCFMAAPTGTVCRFEVGYYMFRPEFIMEHLVNRPHVAFSPRKQTE